MSFRSNRWLEISTG